MSIEFVGHPGAGKSRICDGLSKLLHRNRIDAPVCFFPAVDGEPRPKVLASKLLWAFHFLILHPLTASEFLSLARKSNQFSRRHGVTKILNLFSELGREEWYRRRIPVYEQGVLQAIWSVALGAASPDIPGLLRAATPYLPTFVVHVETDHDEIHRRLEPRKSGRSRLDRLAPEPRERLLQKADTLFAEIIAEWKRLEPNNRYLKVQNSAGSDPDSLAAAVFDSLELNSPPLPATSAH